MTKRRFMYRPASIRETGVEQIVRPQVQGTFPCRQPHLASLVLKVRIWTKDHFVAFSLARGRPRNRVTFLCGMSIDSSGGWQQGPHQCDRRWRDGRVSVNFHRCLPPAKQFVKQNIIQNCEECLYLLPAWSSWNGNELVGLLEGSRVLVIIFPVSSSFKGIW